MHSHQMNALRQTNTHTQTKLTYQPLTTTNAVRFFVHSNQFNNYSFLFRLKYFPKMVHHKNSKAQRHIHVNQSNDAAAVTLFIRFYTLAMSGIHVFVYEFDPLSAPVFILSPNVCGVCVCELWHGIEHRSSTNKTDLCGVGMTISDTIQRHSSNNNTKNEYNGNNTNILSKSSHRFISCVFFLLPQNRILGLTTVQRISFIKTGRSKTEKWKQLKRTLRSKYIGDSNNQSEKSSINEVNALRNIQLEYFRDE